MDFLTSWIANILVFILLAVVLEMLLPQTALQKYVKFVLGLLLMVIILSPILKLFTVDPDDLLKQAQSLDLENLSLENSIENQKIEIQAQQTAYILEETAVHLKELTKKELMEQYNMQFADITIFIASEEKGLSETFDSVLENIDSIQVVLEEAKSEETVEAVEEVVIETGNREKEKTSKLEGDIAGFLAEFWEVDMGVINLTIEGGQS